jgi:general secretion pathway protein L
MIELQQLKNEASAFFRWWLSELTACLPERVQQMTRMEKAPWIVELEGERMNILQPSAHGIPRPVRHQLDLGEDGQRLSEVFRRLQSRDPETSRLILRLPEKQVLRRLIKLPLATEENLRAVLGFELDQQTPFKPDQVYWDHQVAGRDPAAHQISVRWIVAMRARVNEKLDRLSAMGLFPDTVTVEGEPPSSAINLLPSERRRPAKAIWRRLNVVLGAAVALLLLAVIVTPLIKKAAALTDLQAQVAAAKKQAEASTALRKEIDLLTKAGRFLEDKKFSAPVLSLAVKELTKLLPDNTWLYQMDLNGNELLIQGETPASSTIIGLIEASPLFENVTFRSPVTQNRTTGGERFNLSAKIVGEKNT